MLNVRVPTLAITNVLQVHISTYKKKALCQRELCLERNKEEFGENGPFERVSTHIHTAGLQEPSNMTICRRYVVGSAKGVCISPPTEEAQRERGEGRQPFSASNLLEWFHLRIIVVFSDFLSAFGWLGWAARMSSAPWRLVLFRF